MKKNSLHTTARAKVNLTLHVSAVRPDGYHSLRSLVVFADIGDEVRLDTDLGSPDFSLNISGAFADGLSNSWDNLIHKAFELYSSGAVGRHAASFTLVKNLPVASGIGGGSADAAAALRLLNNDQQVTQDELVLRAQKLGADVPVCVGSNTCLMEGIGETLTPVPNLGQVAAVLVNPGVGIRTAEVFHQFDLSGRSTKGQPYAEMSKSTNLIDLARAGRNDLQESAIKIAPVIQKSLDVIDAQDECQLARMSGSGATCFGLFPDMSSAKIAQKNIAKMFPNWWCVSTFFGNEPLNIGNAKVYAEAL